MRFDTTQPPFYCGIDLHARTMSLCLLDQAGATLLPRHRPATPEALLQARAPSRAPMVLAAACMLTWDGLADRCAAHGRPLVLGPALSMPALHGGKATNDTIDAQKIAILLRGGMLPQAYVSPAERRATRDLPVLPTGTLDFLFFIRYIRCLTSTNGLALHCGGRHDVATAQTFQISSWRLPQPCSRAGVA